VVNHRRPLGNGNSSRPKSTLRDTLRRRSASAFSVSWIWLCSAVVSALSPSSYMQILNRLTPDRRANNGSRHWAHCLDSKNDLFESNKWAIFSTLFFDFCPGTEVMFQCGRDAAALGFGGSGSVKESGDLVVTFPF
jgi:hypothetical protein